MARKVESFWTGPNSNTNTHGNTKYPWNEWSNGQIWELTIGVDFKCRTQSMRGVLYNHARRVSLSVRIQTITNLGKLRFQFYNKELSAVSPQPETAEPTPEVSDVSIFNTVEVVTPMTDHPVYGA
jgi:hypothetical protein